MIRRAAPLLTLVMTITAVALADPYGPPYAVTDMAPFCARCHASTALTQLIDLPQSAAAEESVEAKHLARIRKDAAYKDLSATDREALINAIKWMDEQSSVVIKAPITVKRNSRMEVSVITKGGAGPVVGVSLVDSGVRFQARSIGSTGFQVLGPALVRGPDGKPQPQWAERRLRGSDLGLSTVMITDIHGNAVTKHIDETQTTWILRAPPETGEFKLAAVFFYGTEKAHPLGTVVRNGQAEPRGGISGPSGRIMFSDVINISVR